MEQEFPVSDLYFAAYLLTLGCSMIRTDRDRPKRVMFVFSIAPEHFKLLSNNWTNNNGLVPPQTICNAIKNLKGALYL